MYEISLKQRVFVIFALLVSMFVFTATISLPSLRLKLEIIKEYPRIVNPFIGDYEKVNLLRQWAYEHIDWSSQSVLIENQVDFYKKSAPEIFTYFDGDKGGVYCGGAAYSLRKLYELYGYKAFTVDMGKKDVATHVLTLVEINCNGKKILSIQDPTFNLTYTNKEGMPLDYIQLLQMLKLKKDEEIVGNKGKDKYRDFLVGHDERSLGISPYIEQSINPIVQSGGMLKYKASFVLNIFSIEVEKNLYPSLVRDGYSPNIKYLFLYPLAVGGNQGANELFTKAYNIACS